METGLTHGHHVEADMAEIANRDKPEARAELFDSLESCIDTALRAAESQEQALVIADRQPASAFPAAVQEFLDRLDEQLRALTAVMEQAARTGAEIEAELTQREESLRAWTAQSEVVRNRLAEAVRPSV